MDNSGKILPISIYSRLVVCGSFKNWREEGPKCFAWGTVVIKDNRFYPKLDNLYQISAEVFKILIRVVSMVIEIIIKIYYFAIGKNF